MDGWMKRCFLTISLRNQPVQTTVTLIMRETENPTMAGLLIRYRLILPKNGRRKLGKTKLLPRKEGATS